jgi:serine/threonine protein kinase
MHRDLKPANVFIALENSKYSLKIGDFGLSTKVGFEQYKTSVVGTQPYCAPEVFRQMYSFSVDMFSFGAILYKMMTGKERVFFMELYQNPNVFKEIKFEIEKVKKVFFNIFLEF